MLVSKIQSVDHALYKFMYTSDAYLFNQCTWTCEVWRYKLYKSNYEIEIKPIKNYL
jgi:hypothetical protein